MHSPTSIALQAIESYVRRKQIINLPSDLPAELMKRSGVFVNLYNRTTGELRGSLGTIYPTKSTLAHEIVAASIAAASNDRRFDPVSPEELYALDLSVEVISRPEEIEDASELNPKKYGLEVRAYGSGKTAIVLPGQADIRTKKQQLLFACKQAGIDPEQEKFQMNRFAVRKYKHFGVQD